MNEELAEEIVLIAAPIFAALVAQWYARGDVPAEKLKELRCHAIQQAVALRLDTRETST